MIKPIPVSLMAVCLVAVLSPGAVIAKEDVGVSEDLRARVPVKDPATTPGFPVGSLSISHCDVVVHLRAPDGTSEEFVTCTLVDGELKAEENQGAPPETTLTLRGGECAWMSVYQSPPLYVASDEPDVMASAYELVVTPDGRVFGWSSYPAEPLDCPEGSGNFVAMSPAPG